jgi:hypothetical protein
MVGLKALVVLVLFDPCRARGACPTTEPTGDVRGTYECPGDFGDGLLVTLQPEIEFRRGGAGYVLSDGSYGWKFAWCRKVNGKLSISGRRLDGPARPLRSQISADNGQPGFVPTYVIFPTVGCWEITGHAGKAAVTFVTNVVDHRDAK